MKTLRSVLSMLAISLIGIGALAQGVFAAAIPAYPDGEGAEAGRGMHLDHLNQFPSF